MPNYTFELRDGRGGIDDDTGVPLADGVQALLYARGIVHELMRSREVETRTWRLDVYDEAGARVIEIPFANVDPTLDHLRPELRAMVEKFCNRRLSVDEMIYAARNTVLEARALVARSRGELYVAARFGEKIIRDE
ncbi:MAG TPA: hypothetical protein VHY10_16985 [Xanthobacteraceae bacterium]|jgi:hypothetical protein|nr:hypothetical protein [Xanthobacteraceae bacterium]